MWKILFFIAFYLNCNSIKNSFEKVESEFGLKPDKTGVDYLKESGICEKEDSSQGCYQNLTLYLILFGGIPFDNTQSSK